MEFKKIPAYLPIPEGKQFFQHSKKYKGFPTKQSDSSYEIFKKFFSEQEFDIVIKLGTGPGGFTLFLSEQLGSKLHSFDNKDKVSKYKGLKKKIELNGSKLYVEDIFQTNTVEKLMKKTKRVLILCNNGNKPLELEKFQHFLKPESVIMVHDYFKDYETYLSQSTWRCCAFIDEYVRNPLLQPYYQEMFSKAFWMCRIKCYELRFYI